MLRRASLNLQVAERKLAAKEITTEQYQMFSRECQASVLTVSRWEVSLVDPKLKGFSQYISFYFQLDGWGEIHCAWPNSTNFSFRSTNCWKKKKLALCIYYKWLSMTHLDYITSRLKVWTIYKKAYVRFMWIYPHKERQAKQSRLQSLEVGGSHPPLNLGASPCLVAPCSCGQIAALS